MEPEHLREIGIEFKSAAFQISFADGATQVVGLPPDFSRERAGLGVGWIDERLAGRRCGNTRQLAGWRPSWQANRGSHVVATIRPMISAE